MDRPDRDAGLGQGGQRPEDPPQRLGGVLLDDRGGDRVDGTEQQPVHKGPGVEGSDGQAQAVGLP
jgi:hypothetical protein